MWQGASLGGGPERLLCEATNMRPKICWRLQDVRDSRAVGPLPRGSADREWKQSRREEHVVTREAGSKESSEPFSIRYGAAGFEFALLGFGLALIQCFLPVLRFSPFGGYTSTFCAIARSKCAVCF